MKESEITKFLISFNCRIDYVLFPGGVFDDQIFLQYDVVWGPDWDPISGLNTGTSQMAMPGRDPERVVFNLPIEMVFSSTNVSGCKCVFLARFCFNIFFLFYFKQSNDLNHSINPWSIG